MFAAIVADFRETCRIHGQSTEEVLDEWQRELSMQEAAAKMGRATSSDAERKWQENDAAVLALLRRGT